MVYKYIKIFSSVPYVLLELPDLVLLLKLLIHECVDLCSLLLRH
jgi:hypothetical protein